MRICLSQQSSNSDYSCYKDERLVPDLWCQSCSQVAHDLKVIEYVLRHTAAMLPPGIPVKAGELGLFMEVVISYQEILTLDLVEILANILMAVRISSRDLFESVGKPTTDDDVWWEWCPLPIGTDGYRNGYQGFFLCASSAERKRKKAEYGVLASWF